MARAVRFERYGGPEVLKVVDVPMPRAVPDEVVVQVRAASCNPGEMKIRNGVLAARFPATFPSGQGTDLSGVVSEVGPNVTSLQVGDAVYGWSFRRSSHATHCLVPADQLLRKPQDVTFEAAGTLAVSGVTALAQVRVVNAKAGETVVVANASGGVGSFVVQLLHARGCKVIGIASERNKAFLHELGALQVSYGEGLVDSIRQAASPDGKVDAFIDLFGPQYIGLARELGVPASRISTVISFDEAQKGHCTFTASGEVTTREIMKELGDMLATGALRVEISKTFSLEHVREAYQLLEENRTRGKIVLIP